MLLYHVDNPASEVRGMEDSLESRQALVGGFIEAWSMGDGIMLICNGHGIAEGLPHNPNSDHLFQPVPGTFFFTCYHGDKAVDLTEPDIARLRAMVAGKGE